MTGKCCTLLVLMSLVSSMAVSAEDGLSAPPTECQSSGKDESVAKGQSDVAAGTFDASAWLQTRADARNRVANGASRTTGIETTCAEACDNKYGCYTSAKGYCWAPEMTVAEMDALKTKCEAKGKHWCVPVEESNDEEVAEADEQAVAAEEDAYVLRTSGTCGASLIVSKVKCVEAAIVVGASFEKSSLDGGNDGGSKGRPEGCTLHTGGNVEWWGPSDDNAECQSTGYQCVCLTQADTTTTTTTGHFRWGSLSVTAVKTGGLFKVPANVCDQSTIDIKTVIFNMPDDEYECADYINENHSTECSSFLVMQKTASTNCGSANCANCQCYRAGSLPTDDQGADSCEGSWVQGSEDLVYQWNY